MAGYTLLDAPIPHRFCGSIGEAQSLALREAADTGGVIFRVRSFRIDPGRVVLNGLIPAGAAVFGRPCEAAGYLQPRSLGNLHLTWGSLVHPGAEGDLGFLVLQAPVAVPQRPAESEAGGSLWVALAVGRTFDTLPVGSIGAACCVRCNRPISEQRLKVLANARVCTGCQQRKEMQ